MNIHNKKNIFELWRESGQKLPFNAILDSWDDTKHYAVIEKIEPKGSYGIALGQYFFHGKPGRRGVISNAGTYRWKLKD